MHAILLSQNICTCPYTKYISCFSFFRQESEQVYWTQSIAACTKKTNSRLMEKVRSVRTSLKVHDICRRKIWLAHQCADAAACNPAPREKLLQKPHKAILTETERQTTGLHAIMFSLIVVGLIFPKDELLINTWCPTWRAAKVSCQLKHLSMCSVVPLAIRRWCWCSEPTLHLCSCIMLHCYTCIYRHICM